MGESYSALLNAFTNREVHLKCNPAVMYIASVNGCPFTCVMCKTTPTKPKRISENILKRLEPYFISLEVLGIQGDGEPLMADLEYFVRQSAKYDFVLHMNTTGFLLTKEIADLLLQTRLSIRFSIHAGIADTYKRIMGVDLHKTKERISYLVARSKDSGKSHDFWFSFIVMRENIDEIEDFLWLAYDCGIKRVRLMRLKPSTLRTVRIRNLEFSYFQQFNKRIINEFLTKLPRYKKLAEELNITIEDGSMQHRSESLNIGELANIATNKIFGKSFFPLVAGKGVCIAPWIGHLNISQDGNVKLCCINRYSLGNINDSTLEEIWHSEKMTAIRDSFRKGYYPRICRYCKGFGFSNFPRNSFMAVAR